MDDTANLLFLNNIDHNSSRLSYIEPQYKEMCAELAQSRSLDDFEQRVLGLVRDLGFSDYMFVRLERKWLYGSKRGLLYSLPEELMRVYHEESLFEHDLIFAYSKDNTQPILSSQVYEHIDSSPFDMLLTRNNRLVLQTYKRFGYADQYVIPMKASNGSGHVMLLLTASSTDKHKFQSAVTLTTSRCRSLCKAIDSVVTKKYRSLFIDKHDHPVNITRKPLAVLQRLANADISITKLAKDMSISPITAHQHIAAARKALGVQTNIGAIVKALKIGLIHIE